MLGRPFLVPPTTSPFFYIQLELPNQRVLLDQGSRHICKGQFLLSSTLNSLKTSRDDEGMCLPQTKTQGIEKVETGEYLLMDTSYERNRIG